MTHLFWRVLNVEESAAKGFVELSVRASELVAVGELRLLIGEDGIFPNFTEPLRRKESSFPSKFIYAKATI